MVDSNSNNHQDDFNEALRLFLDAHMRGEKPDIGELINKFPGFEDQIRQKVHSFQKINSLFDTILQTDEREFEDTASGVDLVGQKFGQEIAKDLQGRIVEELRKRGHNI